MTLPRKILIAMFIIFAILQYNDPDPFGWILVYLGVAAHIKFIDEKWYLPQIRWVLIAVLVYLLYTYVPDIQQWVKDGMPTIVTDMKADTPYVELVREGLGLVICLLTVVLVRKKD